MTENTQTDLQQATNGVSLYSSDNAKFDEQDLANVGFNLGVPQKEAPKIKADTPPEIIENIVKQATDTKQDQVEILDQLERMDPRLALDLPVVSHNPEHARLAKIFFGFGLVLVTLTLGYYFGTSNNLFAKIDYVSASEQKLNSVLADKVVNNYLLTNLAIDDLAIKAIELNAAITAKETSKANKLRSEVVDTLKLAANSLAGARKEITSNPAVSPIVSNKFSEKIKQYQEDLKSTEVAKKEAAQSLLNLYQATSKVGTKSEVLSSIKTQDLDKLTNPEVLILAEQVIAQSAISPVTKVAKVELSRINWTKIFTELERVTQQIDPSFEIFKNDGSTSISYSNYTFNAENNTISVSGEVRTDDSKTFSQIANLTDALEDSTMFSNLSYRTFTKSLEEGNGYTSNLTLTFNLEGRELINPNS